LSRTKQKPYYLRQPWDILFRENKLEKVSPWNVNLVLLLTTLLEEMDKAGIDFRLAGTAIQSSVHIYMKKAELLLKMEDLPQPHEDKDDVYLPPALPLPFRFEHTTTTVNDLIEALERALMERSTTRRPNLPILPLPIPDFLDAEQYLLEIEGRADNLFEEIQWRFESKGEVRLTELVYGQDWLEVVRIFMMLLFLAQRMKIGLEQSEEEFDVFITLKEESEHLD
jgi:chromatin segregation and condensation protein Rec8/ScpA/Scc1 (kleisin family)